ncbi:hypothetical protein C2S53_018709 [Perilla frutescens var. hirtella]|uniref:Uncharacterized protein n=1 Tax=Perilla frutescens var. hirtella TaxID=608512 RepID=A0AAD4NZS2_PERFH|nr:hypothetical protein C2S53_018709 [Perilla frutescens var. hirtella]
MSPNKKNRWYILDAFSYGVLLLKKNHGSYCSERPLNLIGLAWELWVERRAIEFMDPILDESCSHKSIVERCINISLLCVQDEATDRPSKRDVITMLTNECLQLLEPKQPTFFVEKRRIEDEIEVDVVRKLEK